MHILWRYDLTSPPTLLTCPPPPPPAQVLLPYQTQRLQDTIQWSRFGGGLAIKKNIKVDTYPLCILWRARLRRAHERHVSLLTTLHRHLRHIELTRPVLETVRWRSLGCKGQAGPHFNIHFVKTVFLGMGDSHYKDETVMRPSHLYNGDSYPQ